MDILRGEDAHHFQKHVFQELKRLLVAYAQIAAILPCIHTLQLGIGEQHLFRVTGHLYFGDNRDVAVHGIAHQVAQFVLRVIASVCARRIFPAVAPVLFNPPSRPVRLRAPSRFFREQRIFLRLHAPSGSVGQVQMQPVQLETRHGIDLFFDEIHVPEMARTVEHHATISKSWRIFYIHKRHFAVVQQLVQRLESIEKARRAASLNTDAAAIDMQGVAPFFTQLRA